MLQTFSLPNGIKVATYNLPHLQSIHIRINVKGGSLVENKNNSGVAHFMEHMLVQGIPSLPNAEEFARYIEGIAGNYGAFTERLLVGFYLTVPATHIEDALRITSEVFYEPIFDSQAIEKERIAIIDEMSQKKDSHWNKISKHFLKARLQKNHPLLLDGGGETKILQKLTKDELVAYWEKYFYPDNTYLLVTGNFSNLDIKELLQQYFGKRTAKNSIFSYPQMSNENFQNNILSIRPDNKLSTCYVDLTFPSIGLCDDLMLRIKQNLALVILGQLRNSRLFKLLRYQKGLVYDVRAGSSSYPGLGYAYASLEAGKEYLDEAIQLVVDELKSFVENGPSDDELQFAKNYLISQWLMTFDHPSSIASWVENHLLWDDEILLPADYAKLIATVTPEDLVTFMQKWWDFSKVSLTIQGPVKNSETNKLKYQQMLKPLIQSEIQSDFVPLYT